MGAPRVPGRPLPTRHPAVAARPRAPSRHRRTSPPYTHAPAPRSRR
ncbi:hypothetical protein STVIR_2118 [Streptomyces viridochromogenes Tue57]|uniref:Uncharacterized protein n=1 Tax=Streptomyces viridochromogenes Tue57 TaxID=1160705 RepID=L8PN89_STRVR|nr:hypothetical protein STVIR_2118 [Streptomyces viridochromogenes Tue57]